MVIIGLVYIPKLAPKQVGLFRWILRTAVFKYCSIKRKFCSVGAKCGAAKIDGLRLGFSNSNISSYT